MAKISMLIPDEALSAIDACAAGNRTAFMVGAALERARAMRREFEDAEIEDLCRSNTAEVSKDWDATIADGLA